MKSISEAFRGLMAALTAVLAFTMVHGLTATALPGHPASNDDVFLRLALPALIMLGMPAGLIYSLYMRKTGRQPDTQRQKRLVRFWISFWAASVTLTAVQNIFLNLLDIGTFAAAALGLFVFTGIWTYLITVIADNPLSFAHLMAEEADPDDNPDEGCKTTALIKRRRD